MDAEVVLTDETFTTDSYVKMVSNNWKANGGYDRFTITDRIITFKTDANGIFGTLDNKLPNRGSIGKYQGFLCIYQAVILSQYPYF